MIQSIRRTPRLWGNLAVALVIVLTAFSAALPALAQDTVVVLTTNNVNMRTLPGSYGQVITVVPADTELTATAISEDGLWLTVAYDGLSGWISQDYVTVESGYLSTLPVAADLVVSALASSEVETEDTTTSDLDLLIALWESVSGTSSSYSASTSTTTTTSSAYNTNGLPKVIITFPTSGWDLPGDQVTMTWNAVSGAASYRIEVYATQTENPYSVTYRTTGTSYSVPTSSMPVRSEGWGYWLEVSALNSTGQVIAMDRVYGVRIDRQAGSSRFSGRFPSRP